MKNQINLKLKLATGLMVAVLSFPAVKAFASDTEMTDVDPESAPTVNSVPGGLSFPSGALVNDNGTIYLIRGFTKIPFTNYSAFTGFGYSSKNVVKGDTSAYTPANYNISTANTQHPWGSFLSYNGTIYYSISDGLVGVPSSNIFLANGGDWKYVLKANKYDVAVLNKNKKLPVLVSGDSRVYSQTPPPAVSMDSGSMGLSFGTTPANNSMPLNFGTPPADSSASAPNAPSNFNAQAGTSTSSSGLMMPSGY